jgi:putative nucleotidyltransferase with HDIG domain
VYSAPAVEIVSVFEATVRLGTSEVRRILAAACVTSMTADRHPYGPRGRDLFEHSLGTAYLAWLIADSAGVSPDEAFVCGLLHDIGKLVILKLSRTGKAGVARPEPDELRMFLAERHAEFGGHFVRLQRLPMRLHDPIAWHHTPELAADPRRAMVVYAADRLAYRYGFGCDVEWFDPLADELVVRAGLNAESLARIDKHAPGLFDVARRALA